MAWHDDTHFNAFTNLVKALEYRFTQFGLVKGTHISWEFINPVVVLQGELLDVRCAGASVTLRKAEHIKLKRTLIWKGEERGYMIDVVTEQAFPEYVVMLEGELERTASGVRRHIAALRDALRRTYATENGIASGEDKRDTTINSGGSKGLTNSMRGSE
jgi:hypothetical protein